MSELHLKIAHTVLRTWNDGGGFSGNYFDGQKGQAIVRAVEKILDQPNTSKFRCPGCGGNLEKIEGTGEGVKHCVECNAGWFILRTSKSKE